MQTTLACAYHIPSEIFNNIQQYQFSKLTLKILIHGPKTMACLVFNNDKPLNVLFKSKRTICDQICFMKSNSKSIKQKPAAKLLGITLIAN